MDNYDAMRRTIPDENSRVTKTTPILDDYKISSKVLGLGINGKVVECYNKKDNTKYALKVNVPMNHSMIVTPDSTIWTAKTTTSAHVHVGTSLRKPYYSA